MTTVKLLPAVFLTRCKPTLCGALLLAMFALSISGVGMGALALNPVAQSEGSWRERAPQEGPGAVDPLGPLPLRVMPLGDSITHGLQYPGGYRRQLWRLALAAGTPISFVGSQRDASTYLLDPDHEGHPGWQIQQLDQHVSSWLRIYRPHVILLHIGTNNFWQKGELPELAPRRLAQLIDRIITTAPNARLYVATLIPSGQGDAKVRRFNAAVPAIVADRAEQGARIALVDQHAALTSADLIDGIHPTRQGYAKMAACWWRAMAAELPSLRNFRVQ